MPSLKNFITSAIFIVLLAGCSYKKEEIIPVACPEASGSVSFALKIQPLLKAKCFNCHNNTVTLGNISLEGYSNIRQCALTGKLYGAIDHIPGFYPMPKFGAQLDLCTIELVKRWIDYGAPNN
jgi:hypothetical protein